MDIKKSLYIQHHFIFLVRVNIKLIALRFNCRMLSTDDRNTIKKYIVNCGNRIHQKHKRGEHWEVQRIQCGYRCVDLLHSSSNYGA